MSDFSDASWYVRNCGTVVDLNASFIRRASLSIRAVDYLAMLSQLAEDWCGWISNHSLRTYDFFMAIGANMTPSKDCRNDCIPILDEREMS
jgi:hypothetical protein